MIGADVADGLLINAPAARDERDRWIQATTLRDNTTPVRNAGAAVDRSANERVVEERQPRTATLVGGRQQSRTVVDKQADRFEIPLGGPVKDDLIMRRVTDLFAPSTENEKVIAAVRSHGDQVWGDYAQQRRHISQGKIREARNHVRCDPLLGSISPHRGEEQPLWASSAGAQQIANRQKVMRTLQHATRYSPRDGETEGLTMRQPNHARPYLEAEGRQPYGSAMHSDHATLYAAAQRAQQTYEDAQCASRGLPNPHKSSKGAYNNRGEFLGPWADDWGKEAHRARRGKGHSWTRKTTRAELDAYVSTLENADAYKAMLDGADAYAAMLADDASDDDATYTAQARSNESHGWYQQKPCILSGSPAWQTGERNRTRSAEDETNWKALDDYADAVFGSGSLSEQRAPQPQEGAMRPGRDGAQRYAAHVEQSSGNVRNYNHEKEKKYAVTVRTAIEMERRKEPFSGNVVVATMGKETAEHPKTENEEGRAVAASGVVISANRPGPGRFLGGEPVEEAELRQRNGVEVLERRVPHIGRVEREDTVALCGNGEDRRRQHTSARQEEKAANKHVAWEDLRLSQQDTAHHASQDLRDAKDGDRELHQRDNHSRPARHEFPNGEPRAASRDAPKKHRTHLSRSANATASASEALLRNPARPRVRVRLQHSASSQQLSVSSKARVSTATHAIVGACSKSAPRRQPLHPAAAHEVGLHSVPSPSLQEQSKQHKQDQAPRASAAERSNSLDARMPDTVLQKPQRSRSHPPPRDDFSQHAARTAVAVGEDAGVETVIRPKESAFASSTLCTGENTQSAALSAMGAGFSTMRESRTSQYPNVSGATFADRAPRLPLPTSPNVALGMSSQCKARHASPDVISNRALAFSSSSPTVRVPSINTENRALNIGTFSRPITDNTGGSSAVPNGAPFPAPPEMSHCPPDCPYQRSKAENGGGPSAVPPSAVNAAPPEKSQCPQDCPYQRSRAENGGGPSAVPPSAVHAAPPEKSQCPQDCPYQRSRAENGGGLSAGPCLAPSPSAPEISRCPPDCPYTPPQRSPNAAPRQMLPWSPEACARDIDVGMQAKPSAITRATTGTREKQVIINVDTCKQVDEVVKLHDECDVRRGLANTKPDKAYYEPLAKKAYPDALDSVQRTLSDVAQTVRNLNLVIANEVRRKKQVLHGPKQQSTSSAQHRRSAVRDRTKHGRSAHRFDPYSVHSTAAESSHVRCREPVGGFTMSMRHQIEAGRKMKKAWY